MNIFQTWIHNEINTLQISHSRALDEVREGWKGSADTFSALLDYYAFSETSDQTNTTKFAHDIFLSYKDKPVVNTSILL